MRYLHKSFILLAIILLIGTATSTAVFEASSIQEWNEGSFSGTSATRNANSGNLGLGYRNGTTSDSLIGYWRLDSTVSGSGGTVKDYSGENNAGKTRNGVTTGTTGIFSTKSFSFDGSDDRVSIPDSQVLDMTGEDFSVSFWIYLKEGATGNWNQIFVKGDGGPRNYAMWFVPENNSIHFRVDPSNQGIWNTNEVLSLNKWYHVVGIHESGTLKMYINGEKDPNTASVSMDSSSDNNDNLYIADSPDYQSRKMKIDEFKVFHKSLSKPEVRGLYLQGKPFQGNYTRKVDKTGNQSWGKLEIDSNIPTNTEASALFQALDSNGDVLGGEEISLHDGLNNYSLGVPRSEDFRLTLKGNSSDPTSSWTVDRYSVYTSGICDFRGSKQECIMNQTNNFDPRTYDLQNTFISRSSAVLKSLSGRTVLNITNSSAISGFWKGVFEITSESAEISPGAEFRPVDGNIIIREN